MVERRDNLYITSIRDKGNRFIESNYWSIWKRDIRVSNAI